MQWPQKGEKGSLLQDTPAVEFNTDYKLLQHSDKFKSDKVIFNKKIKLEVRNQKPSMVRMQR
jgi:hypothetical protein